MKYRLLLLPALLWSLGLRAAIAPDFTVTSSDGVVRKLYQDYVNKQKVLVVQAFFTTCPPCNAHAPYVQALYQTMLAEHPGKVEFLMLSTLSSDSNVKVAQYKANKGLSMPAVGADGGSLSALQPYIAGQFGDFLGTPTFWVIAPGTGIVHFDIRGNTITQSMNLLQQKIEELLPKDCALKTYSNAPIDSVKITVNGLQFDTVFYADGFYNLLAEPKLAGDSYTVKPEKQDVVLTGLSTYDLLLISKHILNVQALQQPWQLIAADANCSETVTTFDIVLLRKVILGITDTVPCGAWRFVPESDTAAQHGACLNFYGVKIGDVTGPQLRNPASDDRAVMIWDIPDLRLRAGESCALPLRIRDARALEAFQFECSFDAESLESLGFEAPFLADFDANSQNLLKTGHCAVSWNTGTEPVGLAENQTVLVWHVRALRDGRLSELLRLAPGRLRAEAYTREGACPLLWNWTNPAAAGIELFPNPAKGAFSLTFEAEQSGMERLQLTNLAGQIVMERSFFVEKGINLIKIDLETPLSGLYFAKMGGRPANKIIFAPQ